MKSCHVLFVCMGNICRSPAGENIFRALIKETQLSKLIHCDSAGTIGYHTGNPPDQRMSHTMRQRGYEVTGAARQFRLDDFKNFDLILTMDDDNYANIIQLAQSDQDKAKVRNFTDFCTEHSHEAVPDPYYGDDDGFELVADLIEDGTAGLLTHIRKEWNL